MAEETRRAETTDRAAMTRRWSRAMGLGIDLMAGMVLFTVGGYWLDQRRDTGTFWTLVGMFMGLVYGGYEVWKVVRSLDGSGAEKSSTGGKP